MGILTEKMGPVTTIVINRPGVRNAVDRPTAEALAHDFRTFESDKEARVAVLTIETAMGNEFRLGMATIESGETLQGATRFSEGAGRHGSFDQ